MNDETGCIYINHLVVDQHTTEFSSTNTKRFYVAKNIVDIDFYPMSTMNISIPHRTPGDSMPDNEPADFNDVHEWRKEEIKKNAYGEKSIDWPQQ